MLGLSKINFHLNICIYSSSAILAVSPSDNDNLSLAVSFTKCVIKDNRKGFPLCNIQSDSWRTSRELQSVVVNCRRLIRAAVLFIFRFIVSSNCLHL